MGAVGSREEPLGCLISVHRLGSSRSRPSLHRFTPPFLLSLPAAVAHPLAARAIVEEGSLGEQSGRLTLLHRLGSSPLRSSLHRSTRLFLLSPRAHSRPFTVPSLRCLRTATRPPTLAMVLCSLLPSNRGKRSPQRSIKRSSQRS